MNLADFHTILNQWSKADDPEDLANIVLNRDRQSPENYKKQSPVNSSNVAEEVNTKIQNFLQQNRRLINASDLPALEDLGGLVHTFAVLTKETLGEKKGETLEKIVKDITNSLREKTGKINVTSKINNSDDSDIDRTIEELWNPKDSDTFKKTITSIFQVADIKFQEKFFRRIEEVHGKDKNFDQFLTHIISVLPKHLTYLNLKDVSSLKDHHVESIINRMNNLQELNLGRYILTSEEINEIAKKLPKLQRLEISPLCLSKASIEALNDMPNLRQLKVFENYREFNFSKISFEDSSDILAAMREQGRLPFLDES
jgi:uncharacterized protein YejL (UPF0352 family)